MSEHDLEGRRAALSASTSGIGYAIAKRLLELKATVVINGRSQDSIDEAVTNLGPLADRAEGIVADLASAEGCATFIEAVGKVDILINNLGLFAPKPFVDLGDDDWQQALDVNLWSGVRLTRALLPSMMENGWGRIVFVSSESALNVFPDLVAYGTMKAAVLALSRGVAETAGGTGVTSNAVMPGPTITEKIEDVLGEMDGDRAEATQTFFDEQRPGSLTRRMIEPHEIGAAVGYLCSDAARSVTGTALRVDGGVVRSII